MKLFLIIILSMGCVNAQKEEIVPDLLKVNDTTLWHLSDREILGNNPVHLSEGDGDGILWLKDLNFGNGKIELDIKGRDTRGKSFVGLAFHGVDRNKFDLVYFRPFNFKSEEKQGNSVQYVSLPDFGWKRLREEHPGVYENPPKPVPDPNEWFHATIVVKHPMVEVFVNNSDEPSLTVEQLSSQEKGWIGLWVGSYSDGQFKNLKIKNN